MTHYATFSGPLQRFVGQLPRRPRATDDFTHGLYREAQSTALDRRYIQPDPETRRSWLILDGDHPESGAGWIDHDLPRPHIFVGNRHTGRGHSFIGLQTPVATGLNSHTAPLNWLAQIEAGFIRMTGSDPSYSGVAAKNPLHPDWYIHLHDAPLLTLSDLSEALPRSISRKKVPREELAGLSRHVDLFDSVRHWAYGEVKAAKQGGNSEAWSLAVLQRACQMNRYDHPLPLSSLRSTAKSIARWTWRNADNLGGSVLGGVKRSRQKSHVRETFTAAQAQQRMADGAGYTHAVRRSATFDAITGAIAQLAAQGIQSPTQAQIASLAGRSLPTVRAYLTQQRDITAHS